MKMRTLAVVAALLLPALAAGAETPQPTPQVGDTHLLTMTYATEQQSGDQGSGSSSGRNALQERVVAIRDDGLELEYDFPEAVPEGDRGPVWQLPMRVFMPRRGPPQLLNRAELEARVESWLAAARIPRSACGTWYFTWNAFQVECDPDSAIEMIGSYDLRVDDLREGALYRDAAARAPAPLTRRSTGPEGATFVAELAVDPDVVRTARAESDLVTAQIMGTTLTRDDALRARAAEQVSGTITVTLEANSTGAVWRRTRVTRLETRKADGVTETETATETVERRRATG